MEACGTILHVEDEAMIRMLVEEALAEHGHEVLAVGDARSGLAALSSRRIDVLATDLGLPGEMDGQALADAARVDRPNLPVLRTTAHRGKRCSRSRSRWAS